MTNPSNRTSDEIRQAIVDLLPMVNSLREIGRILGINSYTATVAARPYIAIMRATGTLPLCECGREKFHHGGCSRLMPFNPMFHDTPDRLERSAAIVAEIMTGDTYPDIAKRVGMSIRSLRDYVKYMTPTQLHRRKALERARGNGREKAPSYRPKHDTLYRQIAAAVPAWLDHHLHDDVISEVYLAILDGTIAKSEVRANADRFARAARNAFTSKWGNLSLDEKRFDDSDATIGSMIPDPAALAAFDYIFEEAL